MATGGNSISNLINPRTLERLRQLASRLPPEKPAPRQTPEQVDQLVDSVLNLRGNRAETERTLREGTPEERGAIISGLQATSSRIRIGGLNFSQGQNLILEAVARTHPDTLRDGFYTASGRTFPLVSYDQPESLQQLLQNLRDTGFEQAASVIEAEAQRRSNSVNESQAAAAPAASPSPGVAQPTESDPFPVNSQADRQAQVQSLEAPVDGLLMQRVPSLQPEGGEPAAPPSILSETSATVEPLPMRGRGFRGMR